MNTYKFEDSTLPPSLWKQGHYKVGDRYFNKKFNALLDASTTKEDLTWDFHRDTFSAQCKLPRINVPLLDLYKARAQQLRDQYDYLILAYSGGADSDNMLKAFIDNNIKLEEVWCDWPHEIIRKAGYVLNNSKEASNMPSEWHYAIKPGLDKLALSNPEIKIHLSDCSTALEDEDAEDTQSLVSVPTVYTTIKRFRYIEKYVHDLNANGKRVGIIFGIDKCLPWQFENKYGFVFSDSAVYFKSHATNNNMHVVEYFYWTPDFPSIAIEQAHRVWDFLKLHPDFTKEKLSEMVSSPVAWTDRNKTFDQIIKQICYPKWDLSTHQVNKTGHFLNEQFSKYTRVFNNERFYQSWVSNTKEMMSKLDPSIAFRNKKNLIDDTTKFYNFHVIGEFNV